MQTSIPLRITIQSATGGVVSEQLINLPVPIPTYESRGNLSAFTTTELLDEISERLRSE